MTLTQILENKNWFLLLLSEVTDQADFSLDCFVGCCLRCQAEKYSFGVVVVVVFIFMKGS